MLLFSALLVAATTVTTEGTILPHHFPPQALQAPRMLKRSRKRCDRTHLATLNCRTLLADEKLGDLDITLAESGTMICALQETRRDGFMSTTTEHYKIFWYGECSGHRGVGFAVHKKFVHLVKAARPVPNTDGRLMTLDILLHDTEHPTTLICAYSPTNTSSLQTRDKFYSKLREIATPDSWLLGDFNARVGRSLSNADVDFGADQCDTVGPWSLKGDVVPNANGSSLLDIASENHLRHVSSHFDCRDSKRWTWKHPRYGTRAVLDHVFVPASQMRFTARSFVAQHSIIATDHRMVVCELSFVPRIAKTSTRPPSIDISALHCKDTQTVFGAEMSNVLSAHDPEQLSSDELSNTIRSACVSSAEKILPVKAKEKFPAVFSKDTIKLIHRKRKLWVYLQKSGKRITRSIRETYRSMCRDTKLAINADRVAQLEIEAAELSNTFKQNRFRGYSLLKRQHHTRTKAVMPPEPDFTNHYRAHYQLGAEEPLELAGCSLPSSLTDDSLSRDEFDTGLRSLNENRSPGHDNCAPEYVKRGGPIIRHWLYILMLRIWTFVCDIPVIDCIGCLIPIPKKTSVTSPDSARPIYLLTTIY